MEDINVDKMCIREWWETLKTTPQKLRTLEIVLKYVEISQNWWFFFCLSYRFLGALLITILRPFGTRESIRRKVDHGGQIDTFLMFFYASTLFLFFWFLDKIRTILSMMVDNKGRRDSHQKVRHHPVGDYSSFTQKKKIFLKIISSPPPLLYDVNPKVHIWICAIYIW